MLAKLVSLVAAHCYPFELFKLTEEVFDEVAPPIDLQIDIEWLGSAGMLGDDDLRTTVGQVRDDAI